MKKLAIGMMVFCSVMALSVAAWCGDNGNGTVTVNGKVWLKDAGCLGYMNWNDAMARPKSLADGQCGLTDKSKAGDWRLPNIDELRLIYYSLKSNFNNVKAYFYWSSSTDLHDTDNAYVGNMGYGNMSYGKKVYKHYVWAVRAEQ